jgi:hypothetical protein
VHKLSRGSNPVDLQEDRISAPHGPGHLRSSLNFCDLSGPRYAVNSLARK